MNKYDLFISEMNNTINKIITKKSMDVEARISAKVRINDEAFEKGYVSVHIPIPKNNANTYEGMILGSNPTVRLFALDNHKQRTAYFSEFLENNINFEIEYDYVYSTKYIDTSDRLDKNSKQPEFLDKAIEAFNKHSSCDCGAEHAENEFEPRLEDVSEDGKHIIFTDNLKELVIKITNNCSNNFDKARAIYDYIITNILIDNSCEYLEGTKSHLNETALSNKKGDSLLISLLFLTLCRLAKIPTRWQSGFLLLPQSKEATPHSWVVIYIAPYGWIPVDCTLGLVAHNLEKKSNINKCDDNSDYQKVTGFYFGNIDPYRMVANSSFEKPFYPAKLHERANPYDNYLGEIEYPHRGLKSNEFTSFVTLKELKEVF